MSKAQLAVGILMFAAVAGSAGLIGFLLVRSRMAHLTGAPRWVASGITGTVALVAMHQVPLMLGVMTRGTVLAAAAVLTGAALAIDRTAPPAPRPASDDPWRWSGASMRLAGGALAALAIGAIALELDGSRLSISHVDYMEFHGPALASWIRSGSLWHVVQFAPQKWSGYYPNTGDLVLLTGALPWRTDLLVRWVPLPWLALTVTGIYALGRELGAERPAALLSASTFCAMPAVLFFTLNAVMPDVVLYAGVTAGMLFLVRHWRSGHRSDLVIAALGLGLALGTKWYGLPAAGAVVLVWAVCRVRAVSRRAAGEVALLAGTMGAVGGVWYVRNAIASGNPFEPLGISLGPLHLLRSPPDPVRDALGSRIVDYLTDPHGLAEIVKDSVSLSLRPAGLVLLAGVVVAIAVVRLPGTRIVTAGAAIALIVLAAYVVTPYTAQGPTGVPNVAWVNTRYGFPALVVGAVAVAWLCARLGRRARILEAAMCLAVLDGVWSSTHFRFYAIRQVEIVIAALVVVGAVALAIAVHRLPPARRVRRGGILAGGAVLVTLVVAGALGRRVLDGDRYGRLDPALAWIEAHAASGHHVGMTGNWEPSDWHPIFALFGPRFGNSVRYIARREHGTLVDHTRRSGFVAELDREHIDVLVAVPKARAAIGWARADGFQPVTRSGRLVLLRRAPPGAVRAGS